MVDFAGRPLPGFVLLSTYIRAVRGVLSESAQRALEARLAADPESGALIPGTGGVRKLRYGAAGRGKRGGVRVIYYYRAAVGRVYLITVYAKNVKEELTMREKHELKRVTGALDAEGS